MNRKTIISLAVFVALGVGAFLAMRAPEKGVRTGPKAAPAGIAQIKKDAVDELEVVNAGKKTRLKKENGTWSVVEPVKFPADFDAGVKNALDKLADMSFGDVVSEQVEKQKDMEVEDTKGVRVIARQAGKVLCDMYVGKAVGGFTMVRPNGSNQIWQASGIQKWALAKDPKDWRNKLITDFKREDIAEVTLEGAKGKVSFKRIAADKTKNTPEKFEITESPVKIEKLDESVPQGVVNTIYNVRAVDFADDAKDFGKPDWTVTTKAAGKNYTLLIGKAVGENFWMKNAERPQVYLVPKYTAERFTKPPIDFRDKTIIDVKSDQVTGIDLAYAGTVTQLEKSGADWKAKKPAGLTVDPMKVTPMAGAFTAWRAFQFADGPLGKPEAKITVHTKDKKSITIVVGAHKDQDYFIQVSGRPDVYVVKKFAVDRFLKKPDDLKKADATAKKS